MFEQNCSGTECISSHSYYPQEQSRCSPEAVQIFCPCWQGYQVSSQEGVCVFNSCLLGRHLANAASASPITAVMTEAAAVKFSRTGSYWRKRNAFGIRHRQPDMLVKAQDVRHCGVWAIEPLSSQAIKNNPITWKRKTFVRIIMTSISSDIMRPVDVHTLFMTQLFH